MDGLQVISVDKSKLQKLVDSSRKYVEKLDEYTTQSGEIFMGAFEAAENILGKQDATKEEVDQAYANLRNAVFGLRLLPNKDKLEEFDVYKTTPESNYKGKQYYDSAPKITVILVVNSFILS